MNLNVKNRKMSFNRRKLARNEQMDSRFIFMKLFWAQGVVCPCPGAIIHVYDHNIQTSAYYHCSLTSLLVNISGLR